MEQPLYEDRPDVNEPHESSLSKPSTKCDPNTTFEERDVQDSALGNARRSEKMDGSLKEMLAESLDGSRFAPGSLLSRPISNGNSGVKRLSDLRVLGILGTYTASAFKMTCNVHQPTPAGWERECNQFSPDILIVETDRGQDEGQRNSSSDFSATQLLSLVLWCRERRIPTVLWDNSDSNDGALNFLAAFDHVFTSDIDRISKYKRVLMHERVYLLPFFYEPGLDKASENGQGYPANNEMNDAASSFITGEADPDGVDKLHSPSHGSQSIVSRKLLELLVGNRPVTCNYSSKVRALFGDLVISSDNREEARRRVDKFLDGTNNPRSARAAYMRLRALRKVLDEYTTTVRLTYIASKALAGGPSWAERKIAVLAKVKSRGEIDTILRDYSRQTWAEKELVFLVDPETSLGGPVSGPGIRCYVVSNTRLDITTVTDAPYVSLWEASSSYGAHYLEDAARILGFAGVDGVSRLTEVSDPLGLRRAFTRVSTAPAFSTVWRTSSMPELDPGDEGTSHCSFIGGMAIMVLPAFDHAPRSRTLVDVGKWENSTNTGIPLTRLVALAEGLGADFAPEHTKFDVDADQLAQEFGGTNHPKGISIGSTGTALRVDSEQPVEKRCFLYSNVSTPLEQLLNRGLRLAEPYVYAATSDGLDLSFIVLCLDHQGERLNSQVLRTNRNELLVIPAGTRSLRFGWRIRGTGSAEVFGISLKKVDRTSEVVPLLSDKRKLVVTNHYPSYNDLYRHGFVHSRVRAYGEAGMPTAVFVLNQNLTQGTYEFEGVDVEVGGAEELASTIKENNFESILVHFLDQKMWQILERHIVEVPTIIWLHGSEVQPWYRREFNYETDEQRKVAQARSDSRIELWRQVFNYQHPNLHFVFVSAYFAHEVMEDTGVTLKSTRFSIIHNFIDTERFSYQAKDVDQRFRLLSIRPFASRKYANDLTVEAILQLRSHPLFDRSSFLIVGDGPLFDDVLRPLKDIPNVEMRRQFLTQQEIAQLHRNFGVFLSPTRMDSQGVSRDEAMSSGLVPVTNAVTAIPEFVDSSCGILAPAEDAAEMARGIASLWEDQERFEAMSAAAVARVTRQSGLGQTVQAEIELIRSVSRAL
ncbi:glycosyltransferase [Arthrobacter caoxuetaonis]|uniref:Glycosyltransferase family 4 protein n=1 Tax=Arthrobacter caoxuetaonis TaxID=2886935 RepID=A0A9X1MCR9_9MICC|nr:glycosyltransferase family 4 protein [Arthrobacter caoxuetaonis]MCC3297594.1 glycosyltransferase family 4 protein [Arthrobacter caoxuetaonis]USQ56196.1 glycosyltransferase family 4 protein [Arthrobacter caoxuetaonis]